MLQLITGVDIPIPALQTSIHQPSIKEISLLGEEQYFAALQMLCFNKQIIIAANPQGSFALNNMNNFEIFMTLISDPEVKNVAEKRNMILSMFTLLFPSYNAQFLPHSIYFNDPATKHHFTLDENNFDALQEILRMIFCTKTGSMDQQSFNPADAKAREIAQKIMRGRERVAAQNGSSNTSIFSQYLSVLTVGLNSMSIQDMADLTIYQLYDLVERYNLYLAWDIDVRSRLAGGKPDKHPDNWMKNIH